jgi:Mg-chelatase subunit ChlD
LGLLAELVGATDPELRRLARRLAARLFLDLNRHERPTGRGIGRMVTVPYGPGGGDLDIDASLGAIVEARAANELIDPEALRIRAWARPSVAWCLLVDRSGSMHGQPLATAGLAAAAVAARQPQEYAVLSFGRNVIAPKAMWETRSADNVIERTMSLRGHGTTDLAGALRAAGAQLDHASSQRRITVLLSDCRATEPGDVVASARMLDELVIVAPDDDAEDARQLAESVGSRWVTVTGPSSVPDAFAQVLRGD